MAEVKKEVEVVKAEPQHEEFKGYTMAEIKYQRAMLALKKEYCKDKMMQSMAQFRPKKKEPSKKSSAFAIATSMASKLLGNLNTLDYIMMGISLFGTAKKGYKLIRGKK
ncbi:MAG: hypothetical protein K2N88_07625 [Muribaculaceae bacterium]|nr:hypothetical protein [Muribaculaceae bacterium]